MLTCNYLKSIKLQNFRNYTNFDLANFTNFNILYGPNAVGKTNIIEAIALLTQISSFKHPKISELINNSISCDFARLELDIYEGNKNIEQTNVDYKYHIEQNENFQISHKFSLLIQANKKTYKLNGKKKSIAESKGKFPSVIFTPDDIAVIKGSSTGRKSMVDVLGTQLSKEYYIVLKDFNKILKQKNKLLKQSANISLIQSINDVFVVAGAQLIMFRVALLKKLMPFINKYYEEISDAKESFSLSYFPSWDVQNAVDEIDRDMTRKNLSQALTSNLHLEIEKKRSLIGPHQDTLLYYLNNLDAAIYASQGQQRSIALACKFAELTLIEQTLQKTPILLLDDVMSELDKSRRNKLLNYVKDKTQVFLTTTNLDYFDDKFLKCANLINLTN